jgi:LytR cell envelope-related transcriptional attenuator
MGRQRACHRSPPAPPPARPCNPPATNAIGRTLRCYEPAHIVGISKTAYALATPRCLDWRCDVQQTHAASRSTRRALLAIVQEIGAGAGLAAVLGLAVLSALHLSQARDVRRLREWAGRAPEGSGRGATAMPARPTAVPPPPQPQTAATASGAPAPLTAPPALRAVPQQAVATPPPRSQPWYGRIDTRYVAVALVGLLVLGGGAAYGVTQLTGDDGGRHSGNAPAKNDNRLHNKPKHTSAAIKPGNVTVAVLNGTTVPGLAAALRDQIAAAGFKKGAIDVFSDQQLTQSVVQYAPGHEAEAQAVGRMLGISQREPVTANSRALAGDATVIVIAGADKAP